MGSSYNTSSGGNTAGAASSTDNAVARFDGTTGKTLQNSAVTVDDSGSITIPSGQTLAVGTIGTFGYTDQVGPTFRDNSGAGFTATINTQALTANHAYTAPNVDGRWKLGLSSRVSTQFDKTSSTVLANVTGLSLSVAAGLTYHFEAFLHTTSNIAAGVQFAISGTATATAIIYEAIVESAAAIAAQSRTTTLGNAVGAATAVTAAFAYITGTITVNAAGTLTVQFAQNASNGAASSVLVGSAFTAEIII